MPCFIHNRSTGLGVTVTVTGLGVIIAELIMSSSVGSFFFQTDIAVMVLNPCHVCSVAVGLSTFTPHLCFPNTSLL